MVPQRLPVRRAWESCGRQSSLAARPGRGWTLLYRAWLLPSSLDLALVAAALGTQSWTCPFSASRSPNETVTSSVPTQRETHRAPCSCQEAGAARGGCSCRSPRYPMPIEVAFAWRGLSRLSDWAIHRGQLCCRPGNVRRHGVHTRIPRPLATLQRVARQWPALLLLGAALRCARSRCRDAG